MRVYLATSNLIYRASLIKNDIKNILFAYPYATHSLLEDFNEYLEQVKDVNFLLDSGAFSVWTLGKRIDRDKYCQFCQDMLKIYKPKVKDMRVVNLDVIPGKFKVKPTKEEVEESARLGRENFLYLRSQGVETIPVYHQHEDMKWLELMVKDTDYIGISPANDITTAGRMVWMDQCYSFLKASIKTHSFGGISPRLCERYPLFSGDSSSWTAHYRFGRGGKFNFTQKAADKQGRAYMTDKEVDEYKKMETFMTKLWESRGVKWE